MKTSELILRQVVYLRHCFDESASAAADYASAKNAYENAEAKAGNDLISGVALYGDEGEPLKITNDEARKAYKKDRALVQSQALNTAKELKEITEKRVEVEISVLSALKQIAINETFDDNLLAKYDLLGDAAGI
jgi:hypothetical protein